MHIMQPLIFTKVQSTASCLKLLYLTGHFKYFTVKNELLNEVILKFAQKKNPKYIPTVHETLHIMVFVLC